MLEAIVGSRLRARVLGWLFTHPGERFYVRQLHSLLGEDSTNLSRELARLARQGILVRTQEGRQTYYRTDERCPLFPELKGLAVKTAGLADHLRAALAPIAAKIRSAFIFGSFACGEGTGRSDVDLFLTGMVSLRRAAALLAPAARRLGREINPVVYAPAELARRVRNEDHFIREILAGPKIFLVGDDDALARTAGRRTVAGAQDVQP